MRKVSTKWPKIITCVCAVGIVMYIVTSLQSGVFSWNTFSIKLVTYGLWPVVLWSIWAFVCLVSGEKKQAGSQTTKAAKEQVGWLAFALLFVVLTAIIVVHFSNTPAATRADNGDAETYYNRGIEYYKKGESVLAISDFSKTIEINPRYAEAYNNRGNAYDEEGEPVSAISDYTKAIEINPKLAYVYNNRAIAYYKEGARDLAISDWSKAIEINPDDAEAYYIRGLAYDEEGESVLAISDFSKAIEINPRYAQVYYYRGNAYRSEGAFNLAISDYTKAIEINPRYGEAYYWRGSAYAKEGARDLAISDFTKVIETNSVCDFMAYMDRGVAYCKEGARDLAISDFSKLIELHPSPLAYRNRGMTYAEEGAFGLAISDYTKAIEMYPDYAEAYYSRGIAYYKKDELDKAWKDVHKAQDLGYQVSPEFIEQLRASIVLKRKLGPDYPPRTPGAAAPRPTGPKIDPHEVINTKLESLWNNYKQQFKTLESADLDVSVFNRIASGMRNEYDQAKGELTGIQSQFKLIDDLVKSGQMDSDAGYKAKMELAVSEEVFDAMFSKVAQEPRGGFSTAPAIDPHEVINTKLKSLFYDFKKWAEDLRKTGISAEEYNPQLAIRQAQYDRDKRRLTEIQSQFKLIDDLVKSGQMDSDAGYKAKMELAVPKAVFDAMFP